MVGCIGFNGPIGWTVFQSISGRLSDRRRKKSKMPEQPFYAPTVFAIGPCSTIIQLVGRRGTESSTIAPSDQLQVAVAIKSMVQLVQNI